MATPLRFSLAAMASPVTSRGRGMHSSVQEGQGFFQIGALLKGGSRWPTMPIIPLIGQITEKHRVRMGVLASYYKEFFFHSSVESE